MDLAGIEYNVHPDVQEAFTFKRQDLQFHFLLKLEAWLSNIPARQKQYAAACYFVNCYTFKKLDSVPDCLHMEFTRQLKPAIVGRLFYQSATNLKNNEQRTALFLLLCRGQCNMGGEYAKTFSGPYIIEKKSYYEQQRWRLLGAAQTFIDNLDTLCSATHIISFKNHKSTFATPKSWINIKKDFLDHMYDKYGIQPRQQGHNKDDIRLKRICSFVLVRFLMGFGGGDDDDEDSKTHVRIL